MDRFEEFLQFACRVPARMSRVGIKHCYHHMDDGRGRFVRRPAATWRIYMGFHFSAPRKLKQTHARSCPTRSRPKKKDGAEFNGPILGTTI